MTFYIEEIIRTKIGLLVNGISIDRGTLEKSNFTYKENNYGYNNPNWCVNHDLLQILPTEILLDQDVIVSFRYREASPYSVKFIDERFFLVKGHTPLFPIDFTCRPRFWEKSTSDGVAMKSIGSVYGRSALTFFLMNFCEYFHNARQCTFCSLQTKKNDSGSVNPIKDPRHIVETIREAKSENYKYTNFIGGSFFDTDSELKLYIRTLKKCREQLDCSTFNGFVVTMPPDNENLISDLHETGITGVKFNLETGSESSFKKLCPGKSAFGYNKIIDRLEFAINVFGRNNVYSNIILGLEDPKFLIERAASLAKSGIGVVPHILHKDLNTSIELVDLSIDEILDVYVELDKINKSNGLYPWLDHKSLRGCISWEVYQAYL